MNYVYRCALVLASLVFTRPGVAAPAEKGQTITISGKVGADCVHRQCGGVIRLVLALPGQRTRYSTMARIRSNGTFAIKAAAGDLPAGRYGIETGSSVGHLGPTGEIIDIDGHDKDLGVICFEDSCKDL